MELPRQAGVSDQGSYLCSALESKAALKAALVSGILCMVMVHLVGDNQADQAPRARRIGDDHPSATGNSSKVLSFCTARSSKSKRRGETLRKHCRGGLCAKNLGAINQSSNLGHSLARRGNGSKASRTRRIARRRSLCGLPPPGPRRALFQG